MDRALRPNRFDNNPNDSNAAKEFQHWIKTFEHYAEALPQDGLDKYKVLANFVSPQVYDYISDQTTYASAVEVLKALYVKPTNEIFARHILATRRQQSGESIDNYLQVLKTLSKDCNFGPVDKDTYTSESIRGAFINGIQSQVIRQRLLENSTLDLKTMYDQARSLDIAQKNSESFVNYPPINAAMNFNNNKNTSNKNINSETTCWNCGKPRHPRKDCPAKNVECFSCKKKGHFKEYCKSTASSVNASLQFLPNSDEQPQQQQQQQQIIQQTQLQLQQLQLQQQQLLQQQQRQQQQQSLQQQQHQLQQNQQQQLSNTSQFSNSNVASLHYQSYMAAVPATPSSLQKAIMEVTVNKTNVMDALVDSGSSDSFIHPDLVEYLQLQVWTKKDGGGQVMMASTSMSKQVSCVTYIDVNIQGRVYENLELTIMEDLCVKLLLGLDFQGKHESVTFKHGGPLPPLVICNTATIKSINTEPPQLFAYLSNDCKPIAAKSRSYSKDDRDFIKQEKEFLLSNGSNYI